MHGQVAQMYQAGIAKYGANAGSTIPVKVLEDLCQTKLSDEKLKKQFENWTYTSELVDGSYLIVHEGIENPYDICDKNDNHGKDDNGKDDKKE